MTTNTNWARLLRVQSDAAMIPPHRVVSDFHIIVGIPRLPPTAMKPIFSSWILRVLVLQDRIDIGIDFLDHRVEASWPARRTPPRSWLSSSPRLSSRAPVHSATTRAYAVLAGHGEAFTRPPLIFLTPADIGAMLASGICPPATACSAGPAPVNGACGISTLACSLKMRSAERCGVVADAGGAVSHLLRSWRPRRPLSDCCP